MHNMANYEKRSREFRNKNYYVLTQPLTCTKDGNHNNAVKQQQSTNLLNKILHFILQTPPLEFDSDQFVGTHVWAVFLVRKLLLHIDKNINIIAVMGNKEHTYKERRYTNGLGLNL